MSPSRLSRPDGDVISISSLSSNETMDDITGAGRNLGKVYLHFGRKLETLLNAIASSRGLGPINVRRRIEYLLPLRRPHWRDDSKPSLCPNDRGKVKKELKKLIAYTKYDFSFQIESLPPVELIEMKIKHRVNP